MSSRRYRSALACEKCRRRKVRCSVTVTGVPCIPCTQDGSECTVRHGTPQIQPRNRSVAPRPARQNSTAERTGPLSPTSDNIGLSPLAGIGPGREELRSARVQGDPRPSDNSYQNEERSAAEIATAAFGQNKTDEVPFYTGTQINNLSLLLRAKLNFHE
ncbi:hypothetical protein AJ79_00198 [Helicocarpus griseus UAMH5409]|uniref:Zn(2)-C6 fungal-type domain-containing protein n=1 Tax=Helicocarpus griseus UAMH5409 TaxID=1447875 RepID=A0A2B7YBY7_9EURO|nr:hypothetical protein AJ79_00198 [Helicocarpus griseus UAMH5409]